ncbi:heme biosynthesis HemY N-terminal domain-containing protein [Oleiagrimonas sp. C23AA]|uniref:heme biosynthesis protein HemY n=1 Tax=Oleiagrimonas sp. C23AA TaxID=2719047 RepID=UPI00141DCFC1|nr:heme biosynthesis HemY N-terminal domain-containing protein [Oleiagrimonas sp. C23AA]NII12321.1 heme biosynthesis protein HemY [Oleiagrimonas sp. C23AA]
MRLWRWILLLILLAALAAAGWHWLAQDPGYVLVRIRGWRVQSTLVVAVLLVALALFLLGLVWRLLSWPFGAVTRRHRRISRQRLSEGLVALAEGRHAAAERALGRAARHHPLRGPALLASAEAASQRGDVSQAQHALDQAAADVPQAARVLRARVLRREGRDADALALLMHEAEAGKLPPAGWREYVEAALAAGDLEHAREGLEPLRKSGALQTRLYAELEARVIGAWLARIERADALAEAWGRLPRSQRRAPGVVDAYARRAAQLGASLAAMDEVEAALRRQWSSPLAATYGALEGRDTESRLRKAEGWLDAHTDDAALLATLGRLCVRLKLWGKAHQYLERSLRLAPSSNAWEVQGDAYLGQGNTALAQHCYRNALRLARGEPVDALPGTSPVAPGSELTVTEERDEHGMPRMPGPPAA